LPQAIFLFGPQREQPRSGAARSSASAEIFYWFLFGTAQYPTDYESLGRMPQLKTYRTATTTPDITTWTYDDASDLLSDKTYADGKLSSRTQ